ncbi:MAG: hypothetical protein AAF081_12635 [Actinomycetota bacterium]
MEDVGPAHETLEALPIDAGGRRSRRQPHRTPGGRPSAGVLVTLLAALAGVVVLANVFLGGSDSVDEERAAPEPIAAEPESVVIAEAPDPTAIPMGYDDLLEGQYLRHAPDGLPGSAGTVTVMCRAASQSTQTSTLDECDSGTAQRATTSPGGQLYVGFQVYRTINTGRAGTLDCAAGGCEVRTYSDRFAGVAARVPVGFESTGDDATIATFRVDVADRLTVGSAFTVVGEGFPPNTLVHVRPCQMGVAPDPFACAWVLEDTRIETEADGTFRFDGVADWEIGIGPDGRTCEELTEGVCAMNVSIPGAPRQPAAVPLDFFDFGPDVDLGLPRSLSVEPNAALVDGHTVTVLADGAPYDGTFGLFVCLVDNPGDCAWAADVASVADGQYALPRSFVTLRGTRHDCALDGGCVVSVFVPTQLGARVDVPVSFDPEVPLRPAEGTDAQPTTDLSDGDIVTIQFERPVRQPVVAVCATERSGACQAVPLFGETQDRVSLEVRTWIVTPVGPHDCILDGPCELSIWSAAGFERFEPIPLEYRAISLPEPRVAVRPNGALEHGRPVQVAVSGMNGPRAAVSVCEAGTNDCSFVDVVDTGSGKGTIDIIVSRTVLVYRQFFARLDVIDCGEVPCEIRVAGERASASAALAFATGPPPPPPQVAVEGRFAGQALPVAQPVRVEGRGFLPLTVDTPYSVALCPAGLTIDVRCLRVGELSGRDIGSEGSFSTEISIPSGDAGPDASTVRGRGADGCELVVTNGYGEPARLRVETSLP